MIVLQGKEKDTGLATTEQIARKTRLYRKIHKWFAVPLFVFMFLIGCTGLLLGWKKQIALLPPTQKGSGLTASEWLSLDRIQQIAQDFARDSLRASAAIDRIDIRPQKGVAKIVFLHHFTEIQIDCRSGAVLSSATRRSDFIEKIHDGSILDHFLETESEQVKLTYTTIVSSGLILLSISGFVLWNNPRRIRKQKAKG